MTIRSIQKLRLPPLPSIRDIIQLYGLQALKQLSQNFLLDLRLTDKIVRAAGNIRDGEIVEVGPGPGGITRSIINRNPSRVILIEKDKRFFPALEMLAEASNCPVEVILGDVRTFNMEKMFKEENRKSWVERSPNIHLIGNLPFSVSTYLIIHWLEAISLKTSAWQYGRVPMTLTFQKEVGQRMVAPVMTKQRCRLSIMCQNWCHVDYKFDIPGTAFVPKPDVDVAVVCFVPLEEPIIKLPFKLVEKVSRCVFTHRQKYCHRGLQLLFPVSSRERLCKELFSRADIDPMARPFQLTVPEVGRLCFAYTDILDREPKLAMYNARAKKTIRESMFENDDDEGNEDDMSEEDEIAEEISVLKKQLNSVNT